MLELDNIFPVISFFTLKLNFKARVHCFSMQVVMNKCFLLILEKKFGANPFCVWRKAANHGFRKS